MKLTGWLTTDCKTNVECPKCGAKPGEDCRAPKGRKAWPPHVERGVALTEMVGYDPFTVKLSFLEDPEP